MLVPVTPPRPVWVESGFPLKTVRKWDRSGDGSSDIYHISDVQQISDVHKISNVWRTSDRDVCKTCGQE